MGVLVCRESSYRSGILLEQLNAPLFQLYGITLTRSITSLTIDASLLLFSMYPIPLAPSEGLLHPDLEPGLSLSPKSVCSSLLS